MTDILSDLDSDSLFGSPPPSPRLPEGRSTSLALPCGPHASAGHENVGTIALPGSHSSSEPVVNLPASPPRQHAAVGAASVAHAQTQARLASPNVMTPQPTTLRKKKTRKRAASTTPVVASPSLLLPTSDEPPPSNFFRNQQALLGRVGVIAGLNPVNLSNRVPRGDSQNPIVVEDERPTALAAWKATSRLRPPLPNEAVSLQPPPPRSSPDPSVVAAVQERLVRHGAACDVGCCTGDHELHAHALTAIEKSASEPPPKRRRVDPYRLKRDSTTPTVQPPLSTDLLPPEKKGKGKSKKMLLHVLSMLKDALEQGSGGLKDDENSNMGGKSGRSHYRPKTSRYAIDVLPSEAGESSSAVDASSMDTTFPQFINDESLQLWERFALSDDFASYDSSTGSPSPFVPPIPEHISSSDLESWLAAVNDQLHNVASSVDDFGASSLFNTLDMSPTPPADSNQLPTSFDPPASAVDEGTTQIETPDCSALHMQHDLPDSTSFNPAFPIDPALLTLSFDNDDTSRFLQGDFQTKDGGTVGDVDFVNGISSLDFGTASAQYGSLPEPLSMPQPVPSMTLFDSPPENNLLDPTLAPLTFDQILPQSNSLDSLHPQGVWDYYAPLFVDGLNNMPSSSSPSSVPNTLLHDPYPTIPPPLQAHPPLSSASDSHPPVIGSPSNLSTTSAPAAQRSWTFQGVEGPANRKQASILSTTGDRSRARKAVDKEAVLDMARHRRKELAIELARAKIELWETTIEQGVLLNLLKDKDLDPAPLDMTSDVS